MGASTRAEGAPVLSKAGILQLCHETLQPVGIVAMPTGLLLDANEGLCRVFNLSIVQLGNVFLPSLASPATARRIGKILTGWEGTGEVWVARAAFRVQGGGRICGRAGFLPAPGADSSVALLHFIRGRSRDESRLRQVIEERIDQLRSLEHLRSLGEVSAVVVHEIRTPLTSIRLGLEALHRSAWLDPRLRSRVDVVVEQAARIDRLLTHIREFARTVPLLPASTSVRSIFQALREEAEARHPAVRWFVRIRPPDLTACVDADRLREILENLITNAAEATMGRGRIRLTAQKSRRRPGWTEMSVGDDGPGVSREDRRRVFRLFFTTKPTGTGLGLSIVKKLVDLHGGHVRLDSRPRKGTRVVLEFPPPSH